MRSLVAVLLAFTTAASCAENFEDLAKRCAPSVSVDTLSAIVRTESGFNSLAIGVVGGKINQPETLQEAVFYATKLASKNKSFSVGLAQINSGNFESLGVTAEELFDPCTNLNAAAKILESCYLRMSSDDKSEAKTLADTISCYYSGNAKTGYEHGYVDRVIANAPELHIPSIRLLTDVSNTAASTQEKEPPLIISGTSLDKAKGSLVF